METNNAGNKTIFGFWVYLMTDLIMFAALFATYIVLRNNTFGMPGGRELFSLNLALTETLILLTSSFTCGMVTLALHLKNLKQIYIWLFATFILGGVFLMFEIQEFAKLLAEGLSWQSNAFMSAFFTLVGTHGLHILFGLIWIVVTIFMLNKKGLTPKLESILVRLGLFWHFLDIVWIFIFTIVYLMAKI